MAFMYFWGAHKLRKVIIFINLKSNIRVGTCLCIHATAFEILY
jgi:hypothetical protein